MQGKIEVKPKPRPGLGGSGRQPVELAPMIAVVLPRFDKLPDTGIIGVYRGHHARSI